MHMSPKNKFLLDVRLQLLFVCFISLLVLVFSLQDSEIIWYKLKSFWATVCSFVLYVGITLYQEKNWLKL